ncbi:MAG: transporter ATP-binding protein [Chlorobi bacterium]|nr:transporter ATP-binding protein [Chlorobiota bacterium]
MTVRQYQKKEALLKVSNVSLRYDCLVLRDISFEIDDIIREGVTQGQIVSLIGRSGIGKTCLFRILAGLIKPTTGTVLIDHDQHPVRAGDVGVVYQNYILFNHRTIYDNLRISLERSQTPPGGSIDAVIKEYAAEFSLTEHLKKYPQQLSGGQRQRVSIIQQVLNGNRFVLLDEPFSGLDAIMVDKVKQLLVKIANMHEDNTFVIVSHNIDHSLAISDSAFIIAKEEGKEGAVVKESINLIDMGFAWDPDVIRQQEFIDFCASIKDKI